MHSTTHKIATLLIASCMSLGCGGAAKQGADAKTGDKKADAKADAKTDAKADAKADAKEDNGPDKVVPTDPSKAGGAPVPVM